MPSRLGDSRKFSKELLCIGNMFYRLDTDDEVKGSVFEREDIIEVSKDKIWLGSLIHIGFTIDIEWSDVSSRNIEGFD